MATTAKLVSPDADYVVANSMSIWELGGKKRSVELRGTGLPFVDASWGVHQNCPVTWFPGNPEGSQQVLGGQLVPSEWEGEWKVTQLSRVPCLVSYGEGMPTPVVKPETLTKLFESLALDGMRLRVKWRDLTREGRLEDFTHTHGKTSDIKWKAKFTWVNRGQSADRRVMGIRGGTLGSSMDEAVNEANLLANMNQKSVLVSNRPGALPKGTPTLTLGQIGAILDAPGKLVNSMCRSARLMANRMQQASALVNKAINLPSDLKNRVLNEAENMQAIANQIGDNLSGISPENFGRKAGAASVARFSAYSGAVIRQSQLLALKCSNVSATLLRVRADASGGATGSNKEAMKSSQAITIHAVKQGETLVSISYQYYKSPDHAYDIAVCNHIAYPCAPDPGGRSIGGKRTLIIPVLSGGGK